MNNQDIYGHIQALAERLTWVAPVGNELDLSNLVDGKWVPVPPLRGFMVCRRSVNNTDGKNTRVDYLRTSPKADHRWKKPFRESEHMFPTFLSALFAAVTDLQKKNA